MRTSASSVLLCGLLGLGRASAAVSSHDWHITQFNASYDGVSRSVFGVNGQRASDFPIEITLGDTIQVKVTNDVNESTCIHWHGIRQIGTPEMDGSSGVTQCSIEPGDSAFYNFTPSNSGTYWWHSHDNSQYAYGLRGPLIIHDAPENLTDIEKDVDAEYSVQLADWYHDDGVFIWNTALINDLGRFNCSAITDGSHPCTDDQPLSRFKFKQGGKYRIRLANVAAFAAFNFSIDNHQFRVIATDGRRVVTSELLNTVTINVAQRYDLIVEANPIDVDSSVKTFWMRAESLYAPPWTFFTDAFTAPGFDPLGRAIIDYTSESEACGEVEDDEDDTEDPTTQPWNTSVTVDPLSFVNYYPQTIPEEPDQRMRVAFRLGAPASDPTTVLGLLSINNATEASYVMAATPTLFEVAEGTPTASLPNTSLAYPLDLNKHTEILLINTDTDQHPFHLHGHHPWIVGQGHMADALSSPPTSSLNLENAMFRDVYSVPPCHTDVNGTCTDVGYVVLRMDTDNYGVWFMHCHIEWHRALGLAMLFVEGEDVIQDLGLDGFALTMRETCIGR